MEISKEELQQILATAVGAAVAEVKKMNPLEQKAYDDQVGKEKRRRMMMVQLGKIEEESSRRKRNGCSHQRYPATAGKLAGHGAPRGQGEWVTGGQPHSHGLLSVICLRCATTWIYRATAEELQYATDAGMAGIAPPDPLRCLSECCPHCNAMFTPSEIAAHDIDACKAKRDKDMVDAGLVLA